MRTTSRDDFGRSVKDTLAKRVQHRCSNPDCRVVTSGPQSAPDKAINVGVAAHITAAASGGPRYDPSLTPRQRSGIANAIWLCQTCAKLVDNDSSRFTADILRSWKDLAEDEAYSNIGKTVTRGHGHTDIIDKWVTTDYVDRAGIAEDVKAQGYDVHWSSADNESIRIDLEGWEPVLISQADGTVARFKIRDHPAIGGYLVLLKRKSAR